MQCELHDLNLHIFVAFWEGLDVALKLLQIPFLLRDFLQVFIVSLSIVGFFFKQKRINLCLKISVDFLVIFNLTIRLLQHRTGLLVLTLGICEFFFKLTNPLLKRLNLVFVIHRQIIWVVDLLVLSLNMLFELLDILVLNLALSEDVIAQLRELANHLLNLLQVRQFDIFGILLQSLKQIWLVLINLILYFCVINYNFVFVRF